MIQGETSRSTVPYQTQLQASASSKILVRSKNTDSRSPLRSAKGFIKVDVSESETPGLPMDDVVQLQTECRLALQEKNMLTS